MQLLFYTLLASGLLMIGLEIFLPGGVLGILGGMALVGAIITAYFAFPNIWLFIVALIIALVFITILLWLKYFPKTAIDKGMTLSATGKDFKSSNNQYRHLLGKEGEALTQLHPAGMVKINGVKYDVVTDGTMVEKGQSVCVISVNGNRIVVRQTK